MFYQLEKFLGWLSKGTTVFWHGEYLFATTAVQKLDACHRQKTVRRNNPQKFKKAALSSPQLSP